MPNAKIRIKKIVDKLCLRDIKKRGQSHLFTAETDPLLQGAVIYLSSLYIILYVKQLDILYQTVSLKI